jgi:anaerobic ribonucleoside-triphosphate reductase
LKIKKRDGSLVDFNKDKIITAISKAGYVDDYTKENIAEYIERIAKETEMTVEDIQNIVEEKLMTSMYPEVAREYVRYRYKRELIRNTKGLPMIARIRSNTCTSRGLMSAPLWRPPQPHLQANSLESK